MPLYNLSGLFLFTREGFGQPEATVCEGYGTLLTMATERNVQRCSREADPKEFQVLAGICFPGLYSGVAEF